MYSVGTYFGKIGTPPGVLCCQQGLLTSLSFLGSLCQLLPGMAYLSTICLKLCRQVFFGYPHFLLPCGFHDDVCLVVLVVGFLRMLLMVFGQNLLVQVFCFLKFLFNQVRPFSVQHCSSMMSKVRVGCTNSQALP